MTSDSVGIRTRPGAWQWRLAFVQDVLLVLISTVFLVVHLRFLMQGHVSSVFFAAEQGLLVALFLARRRSRSTSSSPADWAVATVGGWLSLAMRPSFDTAATLEFVGTTVQAVGLTLTVLGFLSLGRSFGIVAADRGLQRRGMYRVVRHPIYFSHAVTASGFLIASLSWWNVAIFAVVGVAQLLRIRSEEQHLTRTTDYAGFAQATRWRLIPGVY